ncbi:MAG TPA: hypothetical protein VJ549_00570 [Geothrix sp.]|nr:hypothetical protein [Geothrix sp.]HJV47741.1 hypothetical protein [Geothrix sp.]
MRLLKPLRTAAMVGMAAFTGHAQAPVLITPQPLVVGPGTYWTIPFNGGHLYGKFRINDPTNDVVCMVLDEEGLINFKGRHQLMSYYTSGKVAAGSMNLNLQPGVTHYLVFSNVHSIRDAATVVVTAEIYVAPIR